MPIYNEPTQRGLQAWRDSLAGLLTALAEDADPGLMRELRENYTRMLRQHPIPEGVVVEPITVSGIPAHRVTPARGSPTRTLIYFHGGAYLFGSAEGYVALGARFALALDAVVLIPDYRLAPEHPFPTPIVDCVDFYQGVLEGGVPPESVVFAGDSAGGALTLSVMTRARARGLPLPAAGIVLSPWVDLSHSGASMRTRQGVDPLCSRDALDLQARAFLGGARVTEPDASPVNADLRGLPPILVQIGEAEVMLSGALDLVTRLAEHRVRVSLDVWPDMFHVWHLFAAVLEEGRLGIERAASFAAAALGDG